MLIRYLFTNLGIVPIIRGAQYDYGLDRSALVKRQDSTLPLTGVHNPDGSLGLRREIRDLETDDIAWNLYILGLDMMQYTDQSDAESWYQIAGTRFTRLLKYLLTYSRHSWATIRSLRQCSGNN